MSKQAFFNELRDELGEAEYLIREEPADHTGLTSRGSRRFSIATSPRLPRPWRA